MARTPILYPFGSPSVFQAFARIPEVDAFGIRDVTNAQKLALTGITAGQQVRISDAFVLSNDLLGGAGLYYANGTLNSHTKYTPVVDAGGGDVRFDGPPWIDGNGTFTNSNVVNPWLGVDAGTDHAGYVMTYPALQVYLGGTISSEASWSTIDDVADATARLSLLGIPTGKQVHQVDTDTVYQYNGPSTDAVAGMKVAGFGDARDGVYTDRGLSDDGKEFYTLVGYESNQYLGGSGPTFVWDQTSSKWSFGHDSITDTTSAMGSETYPWEASWPTITVTIDHIASENNWSIVP